MTKKSGRQVKGHDIPRCFVCDRILKDRWVKFYVFDVCPGCSQEHDLQPRETDPADPCAMKCTVLQGLLKTLGRKALADEAGTVCAMAELASRFPRPFARDILGMMLLEMDDETEEMLDDTLMGFLHAARAVQLHGTEGGDPYKDRLVFLEDVKVSRLLCLMGKIGFLQELTIKLMIMERLGMGERHEITDKVGPARKEKERSSEERRQLFEAAHPSWFTRVELEVHSIDLALVDEIEHEDPGSGDMLFAIRDFLWEGVQLAIAPIYGTEDEDEVPEEAQPAGPESSASVAGKDASADGPGPTGPAPLPLEVMVDLKEALENTDWGHHYYFDTEKMGVVFYSDSNEMPDDEELKQRIEKGFGKRYLGIPRSDSNEAYEWMEDFVLGLKAPEAKKALERALEGHKPFRRFKDALLDFPTVREEWFKFHDRILDGKAREWYEENFGSKKD